MVNIGKILLPYMYFSGDNTKHIYIIHNNHFHIFWIAMIYSVYAKSYELISK